MDVNDVRTISDAIECLAQHKEKWSISIAVDCGDIDTAVEYVFDLVLEAARRADDGQSAGLASLTSFATAFLLFVYIVSQ